MEEKTRYDQGNIQSARRVAHDCDQSAYGKAQVSDKKRALIIKPRRRWDTGP
jgi:hypothetical protein